MPKQIIAVVTTENLLHSEGCIASDLLTGVFGFGEDQVLPMKTDEHSSYLSWNIANKYYYASIDICVVNSKSVFEESFSHQLEAVVVTFSSKKVNKGLSGLDSWLAFFEVWQPQIKLAVCEKCSSVVSGDFILREDAQRWCIKNGFELVEMNPDKEDFDEYEDYGVKRIKSALNAHTWPSMTLKQNECNSTSSQSTVNHIPLDPYGEISSQIDQLLEDQNHDDLENKNFEDLFQKMHILKQTADSLPKESRKDYAEKVVMAFWKAIDGDKDEILSSGDEPD